MHIEILQEHLIQALNQLQKVLPSKPQLPILSSLLLTVEKNMIQLSGTDLFLGMQTSVVGKTLEEGVVAIPGKIFRDYIASLSPGKITLQLVGTTLTITSGSNTTTIQCVAPEEFPAFPEINGHPQEISPTTLQQIESLVRFSTSVDPTRPVLTALLFQPSELGLEIVGTDGFRLSTLLLSSTHIPLSNPLLLPAKALSEVAKISTQLGEEKLSFTVDEATKQVLFVIGGTKVFIRLIEGEYPPYQKIVPAEFSTAISMNGGELEEHLKRATIFSRDTANIVTFTIANGELKISATSPAYGTHEGTMAVEVKQGSEGMIAFNARYILDFLSAVKPEKVEFFMNEPLTPAMFKPENVADYRYIVMPFRVNN